MGCVRFGMPKEHAVWIKNRVGLRVFVETGTNQAETSVWASGHFDRVVTIEGFAPLYRRAAERYGHIGNIEFVLGDSSQYLKTLLSKLISPALFWLDAHWCGPETYGLS